MPYFETGRKARRIRCGHRAPRRGGARQPRVPVSAPSETRGSADAASPAPSSCAERPGAGLAAVVLPLEPGAGRQLLKVAAARAAARRRACCGPRRCACCGPRAPRRWCATSRSSALDLDKLSEVRAGSEPVPRVHRIAAPRHGQRDRVVRRERAAGGSQRRRPADRRPHVPQRAAGTALRHRVGARTAVPPRDAGRPAPLGPARQGCDAAADVVRQSHVAGAARGLGDGQADGHAADAAAARRRHRSVEPEGRSRRRRCARCSRVIARRPAASSATA